MLRTGQLLGPASNPASRPRTGALLPGTLASPRTGLTPAGCPQLVDWLRHHNMGLLVVMAPNLLDTPPERRARERDSAVDLRSDVFGQRVDYRCSGTSQLRTGRRAADMPHLTIFLPDTRHSWHGLKGFGEHQTHL